MRFGKNWGRLGMKSEWTYRPLGELVSFASGGTPSKKRDDYWGGTIPWISAKTLKTENIDTSDLFITEEGLKAGSKIAPKGSILLLTRGSGLFNGIPIARVEKDVAFNQDIKCLDSYGEVENEFIFYWLLSQKDYLMAKVGVTGIGAGKFDLDFLQKLMVPIPSERERKSIVGFASSISEKIRCNAKVNDNLEQQAATLFKALFVDLAPFDGTIPPNWTISTLGDVTEMGAGGDKPKEFSPVKTPLCPYPIYSNGINDYGLYGYTNEPKIKVESVTVSARGTIGYVCLRQIPYVPIVRLVTLIPDTKVLSAKYLYLYLRQLHITGTGTTQQQLTVPDFRKTEIVIPDKSTMDSFTETVTPLFERIWANENQNTKLAEVRDALLPKLMSGKIDVSAVQL